ncbi:Inner centromere protein [Thelohanellus kitauei]|uniref:Inner centromere protein n=1 Tax=Thelohanellus kitauei TaxID=669202 RepID=A0A0C2JB99_THEKT|nr:Inner centromere protein [Thelohanellus kitauei]
MSKATRKNASIFNFINYKNFVNEHSRKIRVEVDEQIKCLQELENQVKNLIKDEKTCIFAETPTQKRKRLFANKEIISSSPVKEPPKKLSFQSIIPSKTPMVNHFKEKSNISEYKIMGTPIGKLPIKRRNSNSQESPQRINRIKAPKSYANSSVTNIDNKKEQRRLRAAEVEKRRIALEEERQLKLQKKKAESSKIEKSHVLPPQLTPKINTKTILNKSTLKSYTNKQNSVQVQQPKSPLKINKPKSSTPKVQAIRPEIPLQLSEIDAINENIDPNDGKPNRDTFGLKTPNNLPINNYKITPEYVVKKPTVPPIDEYTSYDINNLQSDDNTDDEHDPQKPIPKWAQDKSLWISMVSQNKDVPINGEQVFGPIPNVTDYNFFSNPNQRYYHRTSSAHWDPSIIELL